MRGDSDAGREQEKGDRKQQSPNFPTHPVNFAEFAAWIEQERDPEPEDPKVQPAEG